MGLFIGQPGTRLDSQLGGCVKKCLSVVLVLIGVFVCTSTAKASPTEVTLPIGYAAFIANSGGALAATDLSVGGRIVVLKETINPVSLVGFGIKPFSPLACLSGCASDVDFGGTGLGTAGLNSFARSDEIVQHRAARVARTGWHESNAFSASGAAGAAGSARSKGTILFGSKGASAERASLWTTQTGWYGRETTFRSGGAVGPVESKGSILLDSMGVFGGHPPLWMTQNGWYDRDDTLLAAGGVVGSVGFDGNNPFGSDTAIAGAESSYSLTPQTLSTAGGNSATPSPNWLSVTATPEPNTILLFGTGLALLGIAFRRQLLAA